MNKNTFYISCPIDTYSGYGARSRDFVKALIESNKYDVKILSQRWGQTRKGFLDDFEEFKKIFRWCQSTIRVTSAQNNQVKYINEGDGAIYVKELTIDKYDKLFSSGDEEDGDYDKWHDGEGWSNEFPLKHTIPEWFTEFEKTLLLV